MSNPDRIRVRIQKEVLPRDPANPLPDATEDVGWETELVRAMRVFEIRHFAEKH